jgi:hypothetical protein
MEYDVGVLVSSGHNIGPQLPHEEHLVGELGRGAVLGGPRLLDPIGQMAHKVEEEVRFGHTDHLVADLDKQAEALGRLEPQALGYAQTEVFGARARVDLERLVRVVWKVDLVEDLRGLVLNGLDLDLVRRVLALAVLDCLLEADGAVRGELIATRAQEHAHLFLEEGRGREAARRQPQQLPAALLADLVAILGQLFYELTVDLVLEYLLQIFFFNHFTFL